jgi:DNA-binding NarL/FixJ family response regulator
MMTILKSKTDVKSKKIIVWGKDDLLNWSVMSFLSAQKDWEVISLLNEKDCAALILDAKTIHPDVIIIRHLNGDKNACQPAQILSNYPDITVITVNPNDNSMEIYNKKHICIQKTSDLISAIEETPRIRKE